MAALNKNIDEEMSKKLHDFAKQITLIPNSIQDYIAELFIKHCINVQAIAFL